MHPIWGHQSGPAAASVGCMQPPPPCVSPCATHPGTGRSGDVVTPLAVDATPDLACTPFGGPIQHKNLAVWGACSTAPEWAPAPPLVQQADADAWLTSQKCSSMSATTKAHPVEQRVGRAAAQAAVGAVPPGCHPGPGPLGRRRCGRAVQLGRLPSWNHRHSTLSLLRFGCRRADTLAAARLRLSSNVLFSRGPCVELDAFRADQHEPHMRRKVTEGLETRCCSLFLGRSIAFHGLHGTPAQNGWSPAAPTLSVPSAVHCTAVCAVSAAASSTSRGAMT